MTGFARLLAIAATLAAAAAQAEVYTTISPNQLAAILDAERGTAKVDEGENDTTVSGRVDGTPYTIFFYECDGGEFTAPAKPDSACLGFEYRAYFDNFPSDLETVNQWNNDYHYGSLWRDEEGDLTLQLNVIVEGGVADENLRVVFAWWRAVIDSLHDFMENRE